VADLGEPRVTGAADRRLEVIGGATTFVTMAYILFVNGGILSAAGLDPVQVLTVTALVAGVMTIAMGLVAGYPFAIAPGMGLNAVVAFTLVGRDGLTPPEAMGVIVAEGVVITLLVLTGFREAVLDAIPRSLKLAIGAGIGLFLALIGLANAGFVARGAAGGPPLTLGAVASPRVGIFVFGLLLALVLQARKVRGGLLIAIFATTLAAIAVNELAYGGTLFGAGGVARVPTRIVSLPDFSLVGDFSFGFVAKLGLVGAAIAVFSLMLSDFFDTVGTAIGLAGEAGFLTPDGKLPRMRRVLLVDSLAAVMGGACSSSSATTYIESAAGITDGARTGLASVVTGVLFLASMFIAPLAGVIPAEATACALVVVGFLLAATLREVEWGDPTEAAPAFLTAVGMPFTYSISDGIGFGVISYAVLKLASGRGREVHPMMWVTAAAFLVFFLIEPLRRLAGLG
jgi:AGZA family xanthine/uracil permease-like MFS transporter